MSTLTVEAALDFLHEHFMAQQQQALDAEESTEAAAPAAAPVVGNEPLLQQVLEYITAHPEEHEQSTWGRIKNGRVVGCVGFHAVRLSGDYRLVFDTTDRHYATALDSNNHELYISDAAYKALGIGTGTYRLFAGGRTLDELWQDANELTDGRVARTATES